MFQEMRKKLLRRIVCQQNWYTPDLVREIEKIIGKLEKEYKPATPQPLVNEINVLRQAIWALERRIKEAQHKINLSQQFILLLRKKYPTVYHEINTEILRIDKNHDTGRDNQDQDNIEGPASASTGDDASMGEM